MKRVNAFLTDALSHRGPLKPRCIVLGITGSWAFAAGVLLLSLSPYEFSGTDILIFHNGTLSERDREIFESFGCLCVYMPDDNILSDSVKKTFSSLCLAKFFCFDLLYFYEKIIWLDSDVVVQGSLDKIWEYGPFSMAEEDRFFYENKVVSGAGVNVWEEIPGIDPRINNFNSGVLVFSNSLLNADKYRDFCFEYLKKYARSIRYPDQAVFNMIVQKIMKENLSQFKLLPNSFNSHPLNPNSLYATIVHCFGAYKIWNDGLMMASFPKWQRDYEAWKKMGGSPYNGKLENEEYAKNSVFAVMSKFYHTFKKSEEVINRLQKELQVERAMRKRFEALAKKKLGR